ncbi:hypothetical protein OF83DRAFT_462742 [Amylostereum chailletii]|nr:hypothetical protein OF83DRAFT_462742 [Amylostereum chailletii]
MVFINDKKFACEACIKGHRSSSCAHNERPLYEIKKKGRPVSQCERCRELRTTKKVHSKCTCSEGQLARKRETERVFGAKQKRYIPIVPALPNGLQDAFPSSSNLSKPSANARQKVDSLLNPCPCADVWSCQCDLRSSDLSPPLNPHEQAQEGSSSGLAALARAAELFASGSLPPSSHPQHASPPLPPPPPPPSTTPTTRQPRKHNWSPNGSVRVSSKRRRRSPTRGPDLPPLLLSGPTAENESSLSLLPSPFSALPMPSFSTFSSLAGSGCTCGLRCSCPDCPEHQPGEDHKDGSASCRHCVDETVREVDLTAVGFGMKWMSTSGPTAGESTAPKSIAPSSSVLDHFLAQAARVPPPPPPGGAPVTLPKLCCEGSCGCGVVCGCGGLCQGCCSDGADGNGSALEPAAEVAVQTETPAPPVRVRGSCCS